MPALMEHFGATMPNGVGNSTTFKTRARSYAVLAAIVAATGLVAPPILNAQMKPQGDAAAGRDLALLACTGCHVVTPNQPFKPINIGPPWPPDFKEIANRPNVTAAALQHHLETLPAVPADSHMPNLLLSGDEVRDVVAFIFSLREKPAAPAQ